MGIIFQNGFGIGTVPNNTGAQSGQWYLGTGQFGYQPAWTNGVISWPMNSGNFGNNYGTNDPNEILGGDTAGIYINQYDAAGNDQAILLGSIVNNSGTIMFSQGPHYIIYGFQPGTFGDSGGYGSVAWGNFSQGPLTVLATSNTSFNGYSDGDNNGGGPLTYTGSGIAPNNSELVTVTINVSPNQFTLTSNSFDTSQYFGSNCNTPQGQWNGVSGFTVSEVSNLYCGVNGYLSGDTLTQIANAYIAAGATPQNNGYIFDVVWGFGSTVTNGVAKFIYTGNGNEVYITSVDPTDTNYLNNDNNASNGTQLVGTFNFPATFTFKTPLDLKGGWC